MEETIEVGQGEEKTACSDDILCSGGLGPCIAIVIYNPKSKCAVMMHEANWAVDNTLYERLERIIAELGNKKKLKVFAVGNAVFSDDSDEEKDYILDNRGYVIDELSHFFAHENITTKWLKEDNTAEMVFYTGSGKYEFDMRRMDLARDCEDDFNDENFDEDEE